MERRGCKVRWRAKRKLKKFLEEAVSVELKEKSRLSAIMNHRFAEAEYRDFNGWILVFEEVVFVTVHMGEAGRWWGVFDC